MKLEHYVEAASGSFALPDACFKVKALIDDDSSTIADFANVISVDPSMTSRLLKIANSAIYNFPGQISTISKAISIIGTEEIYNMMLIDVAATAFKQFENQAINLKRFWRMSVYCGLVSKSLAFQAGIKDIERLFVVGLLYNFGELIVAKESPEIASKAERFYGKYLPWQVQHKLLGFTYTELSAALLKVWQIPEKIILPIRHFNQAGDIQINKDVKVLYLATRMALLDSFPNDYSQDELVNLKMCQQLGISLDELAISADFASAEAQGILSVMNARMFG